MDKDRLNHSYGVAKKMIEIALEMGLSEEKQKELFIIGFNHDIGYEFTQNGKNHEIIGGEILKKTGFKFWREIYYHGLITDEYESLYLTILNMADMQIDKYGKDVGYDARLEDIKSRYGQDSNVYCNALKLVNSLKSKEKVKRKLE